MRGLLTIVFLWAFAAQATNYYVSNSGSDAANGIDAPWQTIAKVNATTFLSGDSVFFKRGDTWNESLVPQNAGVYFGAYGAGAKPVISGFQTVTGWTDSSNRWRATFANSVSNQNTVLIDGVMRAKGRFPNASVSAITFPPGVPKGLLYGSGTQTSATSNYTLSADFTGGEAAVRPVGYVWDVGKISSQSSNTVNFPSMTYAPLGGNVDFIIQNAVACLDTLTEWSYNKDTKVLYLYATSSPNVQASTKDTLVKVHAVGNLTFENIAFTGANKAGISLDTLSGAVIRNCTFQNIGGNAIVTNQAKNVIILNDSIQDCWNNAVFTSQFSDTMTVQGNYVKNCGTKIGMGFNGNNAYCGLFIASKGSSIQGNRVDSVGFNGISFFGNPLIYRNHVSYTCLLKEDGAGIYTFATNVTDQEGTVIRANLVEHSIGYNYQPAGRTAAGIYLDEGSRGITVDSNTVNDTYLYGLFMNHTRNITARNNLVIDSLGDCLAASSGYAYSGITVASNIFYQKNSARPSVSVNYGYTAAQDSNYALRPSSPSGQFKTGSTTYSLAGWQTATGMDAHTTDALPASTTTSTGTLYTNATTSDSAIALDGWMMDARGTVYPGSFTLKPFGSAMLFPVATPAVQYIQKKYFRFKRVTR